MKAKLDRYTLSWILEQVRGEERRCLEHEDRARWLLTAEAFFSFAIILQARAKQHNRKSRSLAKPRKKASKR